MNQEQLAHVLRAAAKIAGDPGILVIGSQAILGSFDDPELPVEATRSVEADLVFFDDPGDDKADRVDGTIGEESPFHQTHGYYGQGASLTTTVLPDGWTERLVAFERADAEPAVARCLEIHDIAAAKLVAGREKDYQYVAALMDYRLVDADVLRHRCTLLPGPRAVQVRVLRWVDRQLS